MIFEQRSAQQGHILDIVQWTGSPDAVPATIMVCHSCSGCTDQCCPPDQRSDHTVNSLSLPGGSRGGCH